MQKHTPTVAQQLLQLLFPSRCVACGRHGDWICRSCLSQVLFYHPPWPLPSHNLSPLRSVHCATRFAGPMRTAIHRFKYGGLRALAPLFGQMLAECWYLDPFPVDVIVPVPLHAARLRQRGYNQSALLARELGRHAGLTLSEDSLLRCVDTPQQTHLNLEQRMENVSGAFSYEGNTLSGQSVLLVDDVFTTGATLRACGAELLRAGIREVYGMTLARD
jgi:ComF family protein